MATKTFAPQLIRLLRHVRTYALKHSAKLSATLSGPENAALANILTNIAAFDGENITEQP